MRDQERDVSLLTIEEQGEQIDLASKPIDGCCDDSVLRFIDMASPGTFTPHSAVGQALPR